VSLWTPPNLEQRTVTQPAYYFPAGGPPAGESVKTISAKRLLVLLTTLKDIIHAQVTLENADAPPDDIAAAEEQAISTWLDHLNAAWPDAPAPLDKDTIMRGEGRISIEFYYLAEYYARHLGSSPRFAELHGTRLLQQIIPSYTGLLPMRLAYLFSGRKLRQRGIDIRTIGVSWIAATVQWHAKPELSSLPPMYWEDYLQSNAVIYETLFRTLPQQVADSKIAYSVESLSMLQEAPYYQWDYTWESSSNLLNRHIIGGGVISVALILLAVLGGPPLNLLGWIALLPAAVGILWSRQSRLKDTLSKREAQLAEKSELAIAQSNRMEDVSSALHEANQALQRQVETLTDIRNATMVMVSTLNQQDLLNNVIDICTNLLRFDRAFLLIFDEERQALRFGAISHPASSPEDQFRLEQVQIPLEAAGDFRLLDHWISGRSVLMEDTEQLYGKRFGWVFNLLEMRAFFSVPLHIGQEMLGVIIVDNSFTNMPFSEESKGLIEALGANISIALQNARLYRLTDEQLNKHVQELDMMRQVDRELMEALSWDRVLNMTLDWALRLTGAHGASLAMVDSEKEELRLVKGYDLATPDDELTEKVMTFEQGVMGRVARTGYPVIVSNIKDEPEYNAFSEQTKACLSVPIRRRGRVIAILNLESAHANYFTSEHLDFVERLGNRASVALDNARLFEETQREREKLSSIVAKTADVIIVVGFDKRLIVLNDAAISTFHLNPRDVHSGRPFREVFAYSALDKLADRFLDRDPQHHVPIVEEIALEDDERYFHTHISVNKQVGWVIVMHDVTPFKETEQLKNELIATVSHDLKNPLSVINGYIELLGMYNELNDRGQEFMVMIRRSIRTMRQLIDDLLDLAHIDAGLEIKPEPLSIFPVIEDSIMGLKNLADEKNLQVDIIIPDDLPPVKGDEKRLRQIIVNLVSNAIKYTPPDGRVKVDARARNDSIMVSVQDDGMGISPEDQAQIFERFYRVRRPETDGIEGTGLGLAIVKSLVEAHGGEIGLNSHLGEGSTFYFTIPISTTGYTSGEQAAK
jgi:signal transduction histidine kinase